MSSANHRIIVRYDTCLFVLNLFLLMAVAFIPFPTEVISENSNRTGTIFYALTISITGLLASLLWTYASYHQRLIDSLEPAEFRRGLVHTLIIPLVFLASIGVAFIDPDLAKYSWLLTVVAAL